MSGPGVERIDRSSLPGQVVMVLQGGGALGAYQAGVYQALHEAGIEPDWVIGTSIGAINAALIVGNEPQDRMAALHAFWNRMTDKSAWPFLDAWLTAMRSLAYWRTLSSGIPGFFEPNLPAFLGAHVPLGPERAGYYSTEPLEKTLAELVRIPLLNRARPRLTVGAARVRTSQMTYFDSRDMELGVKHIMASGALPPAFPAVRIDGELYWDGGILSNTPTEVVFDDYPRRDALIFAVHMWHPDGAEPSSIWEVLHRQKDIQYSSRIANHIVRQMQTHRLRHVIQELVKFIPDEVRREEAVRELAAHGCLTRMHVVRLLGPLSDTEDHTKDVDFSPASIQRRWETGYTDTVHALKTAPWRGDYSPLDGVILHEPETLPGLGEVVGNLMMDAQGGAGSPYAPIHAKPAS